ncbi:hypothetical protein L1887_57247 [Cichorium endivia]|nr:hypothetical protein L1887_57247 [Cichorium endivia]
MPAVGAARAASCADLHDSCIFAAGACVSCSLLTLSCKAPVLLAQAAQCQPCFAHPWRPSAAAAVRVVPCCLPVLELATTSCNLPTGSSPATPPNGLTAEGPPVAMHALACTLCRADPRSFRSCAPCRTRLEIAQGRVRTYKYMVSSECVGECSSCDGLDEAHPLVHDALNHLKAVGLLMAVLQAGRAGDHEDLSVAGAAS